MIKADTLVARRYAMALFNAADSTNRLDAVDVDLRSLRDTLTGDPRFARFLEAPHLLTEDKLALIDRAFDGRAEPLVVAFLKLLVRKRRMFALAESVEEFHKFVDRARGVVDASVTTAVPLAGAELERLTGLLHARTGKKIVLSQRVEPAALGGVKVVMGDTVIDGTLAHFLGELREKLRHVRVH